MRTLSSFIDILFFWFCVAVVAGVAGFIGGSIRIDEEQKVQIPPQLQTEILADQSRGKREQTSSLDDVLSSMGKSMVALYRLQQTHREDPLFLGYALAVTSDGWLVTTVPLSDRPSAFAAYTDQNLSVPVEKIIEDTVAGYTFIKIKDTSLRPIQFSSFTDPFRVEDAYLIRNQSSIERMIVTPPRFLDEQAPGEAIQRTARLRKVLNPTSSFSTLCMPVIRDERFVFGCTAEKGVRSFRYLQRSLSAILKKGSLDRPTLDIPYRNLSMTPVSDPSARRTGALVLTDQKKSLSLTAADKTILPLRNGDIILSVNGEAVDQNRDLGELVAQYTRGEVVTVRLITAGVEKEYRIILN